MTGIVQDPCDVGVKLGDFASANYFLGARAGSEEIFKLRSHIGRTRIKFRSGSIYRSAAKMRGGVNKRGARINAGRPVWR